MHRLILSLSLAIALPVSLCSQTLLDRYVEEAIRNNLTIAGKKALEQKQEVALEHAGKLFGPELQFITQYTLAGGGRSIELPVGFLLNDVYSTLNTLTGTQDFKPIANEEVTFLPNNFYDARFRITQPIIQPEIRINRQIKAEELTLAELQTHQAVRDLTRDVKSAYLQWLQAREAIAIMDQGLVMLAENKRITEGLLRNGMAIPSSALRMEAEIERLQAQRTKAISDVTNAATYFNFQLHRSADEAIVYEPMDELPAIPTTPLDLSRDELDQLQTGLRVQGLALKLEQKKLAPTLGVQVEAGSQAFAPDWGGYYLGGIQLAVPLWDNKRSRLKQDEWRAQMDATQSQYAWTEKALQVQWQTEMEKLRSDIALYESYHAILAADQKYYEETLRRYKEGLASYIELLDARTQVTQTELQQNIARYQAWIRYVQIERLSATPSTSN